MGLYDIGIIQTLKDVINFFKFKRDIRRESKKAGSKFNTFSLQRNFLRNVIYMQLNCTEEDLMNANYDSETMVLRKIQPVVEYLSRELDWGDYLTPQISNFVDEDNNPSLSYGILFVFTPYNLTFLKFIFMLLVFGIIIGGAIFGVTYYLL